MKNERMNTTDETMLLHKAAAYCSATERCPADVRKKLTALGADPDTQEHIINRTTLCQLLRRKLQSIHAPPGMDTAVKLIRYAENKGFERDLIFRCIRTISDEEPTDIDAIE